MRERQTRWLRRLGWANTALFLVGLLALAGCGGGGAPTAPVSGKVTYKGQAVKGGSFTFIPVADKGNATPGKPAAGVVQPDGTYSLGTYGTSDGAVLGRHKVSYSAPVMELPPGKELKPGESPPASPYDKLAPKQEEVEVKSGSNTIDIELVPRKR